MKEILGGGLGGALEAPAPTYDELQGDALVKQIQMQMLQQNVKSPAWNAFASEVMKTKGYPTKTIQEYNTLFPNNLLTQNPLLGATMPSQEEGMPLENQFNADIPDVLNPIGGNPGVIPPGSDQIINKPPVNPYAPSNPVLGKYNPKQDNPFSQQLTGFGDTLGGYGEQIGGFGDKLGGFGEQLGGFGNQITGFNEQFSNINNKLQNMEKGITSLTDKLNNQQQTQSSQSRYNPYQGLQSMLYGNYGGYQSPFTNNYSFY